MGINRTTTLKGLFRRFTVALVCLLFLCVAIPFLLLSVAVNANIVNRANYTELQVKKMIPILTVAPDLTKVSFPSECGYLVLDRNFRELYSNMNDEEKEMATRYAKGELIRLPDKRQFVVVTRENEICILRYYIDSRFMVSWLPDNFPSPDVILLFLIGINAVLAILFLTTRFAKVVHLQIFPLVQATENISKKNLDFDTGHSYIKEIEDVLDAFSEMKESLKESLDRQWRFAQEQKEQIAALTHDLKTPLTVVHGNAELLEETELTCNQKRYVEYISDGCKQMHSYIKTLIDLTNTDKEQPLKKVATSLTSLLKEVSNQIAGLATIHRVNLHFEHFNDLTICVDSTLLIRSLVNVIKNAIERSSKGGNVCVKIIESEKHISFVITDEGSGFSPQALKHATEQFFMDDISRSSKSHYGIGLYMTASIVQKHGGKIILSNVSENGGARVTIEIPYLFEHCEHT